MTLINRREIIASITGSPFTGIGWKPFPLPVDWNVADEVHQDIIATGKLRLEHIQALYEHYDDFGRNELNDLTAIILANAGRPVNVSHEIPVEPSKDWLGDLEAQIESMKEDNQAWPGEHSAQDFHNERMKAQRHNSWTHDDPYLNGQRYRNNWDDAPGQDPKTGYEFEYYGGDGEIEHATLKDV